MTTLVADIETNGLYDDVTKIHCIVLKDLDTGKVYQYYDDFGLPDSLISLARPLIPYEMVNIHTSVANAEIDYCDGSIKKGVEHLQSADLVIGHNWIDYDARVIKKLYPDFCIDTTKIVDTMLRSYMFYPHRKRPEDAPPSKETKNGRRVIGPHSLESWGYTVGRGKVEYEDWDTFDYKMLIRCREDVLITEKVHEYLEREAATWDWSLAENIEKRFRLILSDQESYGWKIDTEALNDVLAVLTREMKELKDSMLKEIPHQIRNMGEFKNPVKKDGCPTKIVETWYNNLDIRAFRLNDIQGPFTRICYEELNLESPKQRVDYLLSIGWQPTEYNFKKGPDGKPVRGKGGEPIWTTPKLTKDSVTTLPIGEKMIDYMTLSHRFKQLNGWSERIKENGTLGAGGLSVGTNTGRVQHRNVVNVPKVSEFYGEQMRSLFCARKGYVLVGADLSALENRLMGHYTYDYDNGEYARRLEEEDPHNKTIELAKKCGIEISRNQAKTVNYALGYGAHIKKIVKILDCSESLAAKIFHSWWEDRKPMKILQEHMEQCLRMRGELSDRGVLTEDAYVKSLDGRKVYVRSKHSLINSLIQSAGSIINKFVTLMIQKGIDEHGLDAHFVGNFHDETQCEVSLEDVDKYKEIVYDSISKSTEYFDLKVPMGGDIHVGKNWAETH